MTAVGWQRVEGALVFMGALAVIAALVSFGAAGSWLAAVLLFFLPDIGIAAYLAGPRIGAAVYNLLHLYGLWLLLAGLGAVAGLPQATMLGLLGVAHVGFDRMLGYGLKEPTGFADTHLGRIGRRGAPPL
jgi:hypothetical protein